ncbi:MAG: outer membrane beta-barrel protein [Luteitalea sp.]|nr:outer membrane beta-barrel protein [Luteitalea sp.]
MPVTHQQLIAAGLAVLVLSSSTSAQGRADGEPDVSRAYVRFGRLLLNPTIALTNFGVDTNVFNETDQSSPREDFTLTLTPQTDLWLRMGRSWVIGNVKEDLVWYKTFASERSANDSVKVGWVMPLNRLTVSGDAAYLSTRDRPGFEIDARSQRNELAYHGGVEIRLRPKTFVGVHGDRRTTKFDSVATFEGVSLRDALNRTATSAVVTVRQQITPLTGIMLDVGRAQDRFEFSPLRDADSTTLSVGIKLDPFALIKGSATLGYRDFRPRSSGLPGYKGTTATADLSYVAFGRTRVGLQATRDVQYSFEIAEPYYLLTGVSVSLAQQVFEPVDVIGRFGRQRLNYRERIGVTAAAPDRIDSVRSFGGSIGYRLGNSVRIGFNVDQQRRTSPVGNRGYHGLRYGTSVTYGF